MNKITLHKSFPPINWVFVLLVIFTTNNLSSQSLDDILNQESSNNTEIVTGTFKGTRIMNGHSIETRQKGVLEFLIQHRFGRVNSGSYELFGLDQSNIRFGFEYAITNDFSIALGRSSFEKVYDAYLKYRILKQSIGNKSLPLSLTLFGSVVKKTLKDYDPLNKPSFSDRLAYTSQLLIARKLSPNVSLQLTPTLIHFNKVPKNGDPNTMIAIGIGSKFKLSNRVTFNVEYFLNESKFESKDTTNSLALGFDIETGGHIFQLIFTNSRAMIEKGFITETNGDFFNGDIHFGFNISRDFYLVKEKQTKKIY
jgi:hypothetical protein